MIFGFRASKYGPKNRGQGSKFKGFETDSHYIEQLHAAIFIPPPLASRQVFNLDAVVIPEREPAVGQHDLFAVVPIPDQQPQFAVEPLYVLCIISTQILY